MCFELLTQPAVTLLTSGQWVGGGQGTWGSVSGQYGHLSCKETVSGRLVFSASSFHHTLLFYTIKMYCKTNQGGGFNYYARVSVLTPGMIIPTEFSMEKSEIHQ